MDTPRMESELARLAEHMRATGYSDHYIAGMERTARWIVEEAPDWKGWDDAPAAAEAKWGKAGAKHPKQYIRILRQLDEEGILPRTEESRRYVHARMRDGLCPGFAAICDAYEASPKAASKKPTTVYEEISNASAFLARLESLGCTGIADVAEGDVLAVLTGPDGGPAFSTSHVSQVKAVLAGCGVEGCERLASLLPVPKKWRKVGDVLTPAEREKVRDVLSDPGNALSLRDRAIVSVLFYTGMRACDVSSLRLDAIDWESDVIEVVQQKTGRPLVLPLTAPVGNAIFDYVTSERGESDSPYVFLSLGWPYGRICGSRIGKIADEVLAMAGVGRGPNGSAGGAHLFRRTAASAMSGSGSDRAVIAATLGHASARSAEKYVTADVERLRRCALDVSRFPLGKGALSWK